MAVFRNVQLVNSYILTYIGHVPPDVRNQSELPLTAEHLMLVLRQFVPVTLSLSILCENNLDSTSSMEIFKIRKY